MAVFGGLVLTNSGRNLLARAQAGENLNFKRIALGSGELTTQSMITLTSLINEVASMDILKLELMEENITKLTFYLTNQEIETGFYWREIGIIADDPDSGEEILYAYGNAGDNAEYISSKSEQDIIEKYVSINLVISNVENISATIDESLVYATQKDLEELKIKYKTLTLSVDGWVANEETGYYEYDVTDTDVTSSSLVDIYMDLINQELLSSGYTSSYDGGFKVITDEIPESDVEINATITPVVIS